MLARRLPSILPIMELDEAIETTRVHSVAGQLAPDRPLLMVRPFRSRIIVFRMPGWWVAGRSEAGRGVARATTVCSFWMNRRNSSGPCWKDCGSRLKTVM